VGREPFDEVSAPVRMALSHQQATASRKPGKGVRQGTRRVQRLVHHVAHDDDVEGFGPGMLGAELPAGAIERRDGEVRVLGVLRLLACSRAVAWQSQHIVEA
ncbi:hypothetical protein RZS08_59680, partial [Arthrospira platensis SPKY1]|nr:hypothetical protein [Arthrospira platensis SPKY1]